MRLTDEASNAHTLPAFLTENGGLNSGFMIVQYTAAALVNDLASRAHPASVYSIPTSANAEDHVSMGANEARHVLDMTGDLAHVIALEIYTAAQALDYRRDMINAARGLARRGDVDELVSKISNAPQPQHEGYAQFRAECEALMRQLAQSDEFAPSPAVAKLLRTVRDEIDFMPQDRAMDGDVARICALMERGALRP